MDVEIKLYDQLTRRQLAKIEKKQGDWSQELKDIGIAALRSIDKNYRDQGRPQKWEQSKAAQARQGMTLVDTGRLRRSTQITGTGGKPNNPDRGSDVIYDLTKTRLTIGTAVPYYKYLKEKWPAIVLQDEDLETFNHIILRSIDNL